MVFSEKRSHGEILGQVPLACGMCVGCRMRRAGDWALRCAHEASLYDDNCVVALTYRDEDLPPHGSLRHRDFQLFMKRVRNNFGPVRFFMCGEYGELNRRPHYHAVLFSVGFRRDRVLAGKSASGEVYYGSRELESLWKLGRCSVQDAVPATIGYVTRYILKKQLGPDADRAYEVIDGDGVCHPIEHEYARMSLRPGIGYQWFKLYGGETYRDDFVVSDGTRRRPPRYYDQLLERADSLEKSEIVAARELAAASFRENQTPERLEVRERCHVSKLRNYRRRME